MKFVVIFMVCCVAFAAANVEEPSAKQLEGVKNSFEKAVKELKATCDNHKTACTDYIAKRFSDASDEQKKNHFTEACVVLVEQYLCQNKKDKEGLKDLYIQFKKFIKQA